MHECVCMRVCMCVYVYVCGCGCMCVEGVPLVISSCDMLTTTMVDKSQLLANLSEFSPSLLFGVLLQYLTHLFFAATSSHIQDC